MATKQICRLEGMENIRTGYYVDSDGAVYSICDRHKQDKPYEYKKALKPKQGKRHDYLEYGLVTNEGKVRWVRAHKLVALAFVSGKTIERNQINHKDRNKHNNCAANLEWVTPSENSIHANGRPVYQYDNAGNFVAYYDAVRFAAEAGFNSGHVASVCRHEEKAHKGYLFSYEPLTKEQVLQRLSNPTFYLS